MRKKALTDLEIKKLRAPADGRLEIPDGRFPGLAVRVTKHGVKTFALRTRVNGRLIRLTLGRYPDIKLAEARAKAHSAVSEAKAGKQPAIGRPKVVAGHAFDRIVEEYLQQHGRRFMKERTLAEADRVLKVEFVQLWRTRDIRQITKQHVVQAINDIVARPQRDAKGQIIRYESPSAANHAFGHIRAFFNWSVGQGKIDVSPCFGLRSPAPKKKRDRVLSDDELAAVWHAASQIGHPYGNIVQLLLVTLQRRSEVVGLRWDMIDWDEKIWRVPAEENKSGRAYLVPLTDVAIAILKSVPRVEDRLLFPAQRSDGKVFADWSKSKNRIDKLSGVTGWTIHDLRRTGSTNLAKLGVAPHIKERVLNHLTGELGGVAGVYDVYSYLPEKRAALNRWDEELRSIVGCEVKAAAEH